MRDFAGMTSLDVWYAHLDLDQMYADLKSSIGGRLRRKLDQGLVKARTKDSMQALAKLTTVVDGRPRIVADPPLIVPAADLASEEATADFQAMIWGLLASYRRTLREDAAELLGRYQVADLARKVVGVGSVGTRCWILLLLGGGQTDPLFLQVKEAERSVLSEFAGPSQYDNHGQRVVIGQRFTQAASDVFLGWVRVEEGIDGRPHDYYTRQLRDWKLSAEIQGMPPGWMRRYAGFCGWTLARAHARTGDRCAIAGYLGSSDVFDEAVADFAASYADQNERDYAELAKAAKSGRITVQAGLLAALRPGMAASARIRSMSSGGSRTMKRRPIIATMTAIASRESDPLISTQLSGPAGSSTPALGGTCSATVSAGACTRIRAW